MTRTLPLALLLLAGCAPASPPSPPSPPSEPSIDIGPVEAAQPPRATPPRVEPTRSTEECATLVEEVRAHPESFSSTPPMMTGFAVPPFDGTPRDMRGQTVQIQLLVDERGAVVDDSTTVTPPLSSASFDRRMRKAIAKYRFRPAVLDGCAVPGRSTVTLTLANR
jgi:hypothetical protein